MEVEILILEYLKVLAWPAVVFSLAIIFRPSLAELLSRLKKADLPGDVSLDFSEELKEAKILSKKVEEKPIKEEHKNIPSIPLTDANSRLLLLGLQPSPSGLDMKYYRDLTNQDPNIALAGLRIEVDILAKNLAKGFKVEVSSRDNGIRLLQLLYDEGAIFLEQMQLAKKILALCNAAIHGSTVSQSQALEVIGFMEILRKDYINWLSWGFDDDWKPNGIKESDHLNLEV